MSDLSLVERETIINFNEEEKTASIFTYNKVWQKHFEKQLGLKPIMNNGFGGKEYEIDKKRIPMPRAPMKLSAEARARLVERGKKLSEGRRKNRVLSSTNKRITNKSTMPPQKMGESYPPGR